MSNVYKYRISDDLKIDDILRSKLKRPLGTLIRGNPNNLRQLASKLKKAVSKTQSRMIITVGDEVTKLCNEIGIPINLAIIDYHVGRKRKYENLEDLGFGSTSLGPAARQPQIHPQGDPGFGAPRARVTHSFSSYQVEAVNNPAGIISKGLVAAIENAFNLIIQKGISQIIEVIGEEDLAGIPAVLMAPLGSQVLYGQPDEGVVVIEVTRQKKKAMMDMLRRNG